MSQPDTPAKRAPTVPSDLRASLESLPGAGPFRVLLVQPSKRPGAGEWLLRAAGALCGRGHSVLVVAPEDSETTSAGRREGLEVRTLPSAHPLDPRTWRFLRRTTRMWRPDGVLVSSSSAHTWLRRVGFGAPLPQVLTARPSMNGRQASHGPASGDWTVAPDGVQAVEVSPGLAISDDPIPLDRTKLRRELRISSRHAIVLQQDAFEPEAGHSVTLRALARIRDRYEPDRRTPQLALLGTGPAESDLHVLSHVLQLQPHVLWIGSRKDHSPYLRAADVVVAPASTGGDPRVVREALAAGVPVVAADLPPYRQLITPGVTGLLVAPGDADALADALDTVLRDPQRAAALARAGREHARSAWGRERLGLQLELLLTGVLARRRRAHRLPAVFVDRDGTLVRNVPYNADPDAVVLEPDVAWVLCRFREAGCAVVVVSNQSAVARGMCTEDQVRAVNDRVVELLRERGADVDRIETCPHHPDHGPPCTCRKPQPGMLLRAAQALHLDLETSVTIGDEMRDLEAGERAGTATALYAGDWLRTGCAALGAVARRLGAFAGTPPAR